MNEATQREFIIHSFPTDYLSRMMLLSRHCFGIVQLLFIDIGHLILLNRVFFVFFCTMHMGYLILECDFVFVSGILTIAITYS